MISVGAIGKSELLARLEPSLTGHRISTFDDSNVFLLGADTAAAARALIEPESAAVKARTIVVGVNESLSIAPHPGSLSALLEDFHLLGALRAPHAAYGNDRPFVFIGRKENARHLGIPWLQSPAQTHSYATWMISADVRLADLLSRLSTVM